MRIIVFLLFWSTLLSGQNYTFKIKDLVNGNEGPLKGVPGDLFNCNITFSNSSSSTIYVVMNRYKNQLPSYWALCYCYIQCHSPAEDSILVEIQAHSTTMVSLQFKTDSVNPGVANASFHLYQTGFESNVQNLDKTASTINDVGIGRTALNHQLSLYPNPATDHVQLKLPETISEIEVRDIQGKSIMVEGEYDGTMFKMNTVNYVPGLYVIRVCTNKAIYNTYFLKQ
jgi:hypothetical protein